MTSIGFESIGDQYVISMPKRDMMEDAANDEYFVPPDAARIKLSEYHALKGE